MKKIVLCFAAVAASMGLMAQNVYQKVTATPDNWEGTYLIVCEGQSVVFNGAASEDDIDTKGGPAILAGITFQDSLLTGTAALDSATFTIVASQDEDWPWAIQSASGLYIGHKDSVVADNGLSTETEIKGKCKHTLLIDENGNFIATPKYSVGGGYNLQYNKKADQLRFRYFVPGDKQAVQIYKLTTTPSALSNLSDKSQTIKRIENGQLIIVKGTRKFTLLGTEL